MQNLVSLDVLESMEKHGVLANNRFARLAAELNRLRSEAQLEQDLALELEPAMHALRAALVQQQREEIISPTTAPAVPLSDVPLGRADDVALVFLRRVPPPQDWPRVADPHTGEDVQLLPPQARRCGVAFAPSWCRDALEQHFRLQAMFTAATFPTLLIGTAEDARDIRGFVLGRFQPQATEAVGLDFVSGVINDTESLPLLVFWYAFYDDNQGTAARFGLRENPMRSVLAAVLARRAVVIGSREFSELLDEGQKLFEFESPSRKAQPGAATHAHEGGAHAF